jgi:hypothetical protein
MTTKISRSNIQAETLSTLDGGGGSGGPKITAIQVTDNSYTVLDDTAVALTGGYIKITGSGFASGCRVLINNTPAASVTFVNSTTVRAQVAARDAGTYLVYLVNTDGGVAIAVDGLTYSDTPTWSTSSSLSTQQTDSPISIQLSAASAQTFTLNASSTLPAGLTLSSGGLLSGTISVAQATTYSFTINAIDNENQDSPRTFSLLVAVAILDPYFSSTSLLIPGVGSNNGTNSTFLDSSSNNFTITRNGDAIQGTFSPFSATGWSNYFDGAGGYLSVPDSDTFDGFTGDFTIEFWVNFSTVSGAVLSKGWNAGNTFSPYLFLVSSGNLVLYASSSSAWDIATSVTIIPSVAANTWYHVAISRSGSSLRLFANGVLANTITTSATFYNSPWPLTIGSGQDGFTSMGGGYVSNVRIVKGTALYTSAFTPSTYPLTVVTNTSLLTCQSNRFKDNSTNNFTVTRNGNVNIKSLSPFNPSIPYSANAVGGSCYFDGSGDYLTIPTNAAFDFGTGDFTVEAWVYLNSGVSEFALLSGSAIQSSDLVYYANSLRFGRNNTAWDTTFDYTFLPNQWYHVAFVKASGNAKAFVNGVQIGSAGNGIEYGSVGGNVIIGASRDLSRAFPGYLSNYRIVKGTAVYTSNFTPPTSPVTAIANTSLLLKFANHNIADATSRNLIRPVNDAKISTAQSKFSGTGGGSSIYFDGSDALDVRLDNMPYLLTDFPKSGFIGTLEAWIRLDALESPRSCLFSYWYNSNGWTLDVNPNGDLFFSINGGGNTILLSPNKITTGAWHHVAMVNTGSAIKYYLNGVYSGESTNATVSGPIYSGGLGPFYIGNRVDMSLPTRGYMSNIRLTRGVARYTANFTPPTDPFPVQ